MVLRARASPKTWEAGILGLRGSGEGKVHTELLTAVGTGEPCDCVCESVDIERCAEQTAHH